MLSVGALGRARSTRPTPRRLTSRSWGTLRRYLEGEGLQADLVPALGDPAKTIADLAKEHDADLIVVGTHEPSVIGRLFGQSVTEAVVNKVHCDVLIVHPGH